MGQGYSLTTLSAGSAGIDVPELADLTYEKSLGEARFMKAIRARHRDGLVVAKAVMKPYSSIKFGKYIKEIMRERKLLSDIPNALGYYRAFETSTNGYLVRQYIYNSIYDRMSTRPFLEDIEKRWLSFQLLCAIRDCHSKSVYHGDIKTENCLVTSWNWLFLCDFSSSFKPTYLPEDNPADFSFFFDIAGRRTCYLAPERFLKAGEKSQGRGGINWAMDIFSVGCVIAEIFLEIPIFNLSQLFKYRQNEYNPVQTHLNRIEDREIREMVEHMIQLEPESRYSADEYLNFWRRKAFPEYFYSFLHQYMHLITDPTSGRSAITSGNANLGESDERIDRVYYDFDKISYFLDYDNVEDVKEVDDSQTVLNDLFPLHLDLPNKQEIVSTQRTPTRDDGTLLFLNIVTSALRSTARSTARVRACELLLAFAERITDELKLDRVLPFVMTLLNDKADIVKVAALRTLTQLVALVQTTSPVNAYLFPEYILPRLEAFTPASGNKPSPIVRATYASCLATLAQTASRFLDIVQALKAEGTLPSLDPETENGVFIHAYQNLYDVARADLVRFFEGQTKAMLTDTNSDVRRAFLGSVSSLCVFFGTAKANDVILSHLNTYLNDRDWRLKCAFFETIIGVATYVGGTNLEEFILPLMVQALTDPEETVVEKVLRSLSTMAQLGLFQRSRTWELIDLVARFTMHPNIWIREAAAQFLSSATRYVSVADQECIIRPLLDPYMRVPPQSLSETDLLDALKKPLARAVLEAAMTWAGNVDKGIFWKPVQQRMSSNLIEDRVPITPSKELSSNALSRTPKNDEDNQWISRLRNAGLNPEDDFKLMALREYIWRTTKRKPKEEVDANVARLNDIVRLKDIGVVPETVLFDHPQTTNDVTFHKEITQEKTDQQHPQTIADALLDASTTIANPSTRDSSTSSRTRAKPDPPEQTRPLPIKNSSPAASSPLSASPSLQTNIPESSSNGNHVGKDTGRLGKQANGDSAPAKEPSKLAPGDRAGQLRQNQALSRKSSAMELLQRKNSASKASAETGTTSENAMGRVEGTYPKDLNPSNQSQEHNHVNRSEIKYRGLHSYNGRDPSILKLLDSLYLENYPVDVAEYGPLVTPIENRQWEKKPARESNVHWQPNGILVAVLGEHTAAINRVVAAPDHAFFITGSDDGTVRVWDSTRLEQSLAHRSRYTHKHETGTKVTSLCFVGNTHCFASAATDGSIHIVRIDCTEASEGPTKYNKMQLLREWQLPDSSAHAVWIDHYRTDTQSVLFIATNRSQLVALDLRTMAIQYKLDIPVHHGTPTCICINSARHWLLLGTSHGVVNLIDLRFRLRALTWAFPAGAPINRICVYPTKPSSASSPNQVAIAGGTGLSETTIWDLEDLLCRQIFRAASPHSKPSPSTSIKPYTPWYPDTPSSSSAADPAGAMLTRFATTLPASPTPHAHDDSPSALYVSPYPLFLLTATARVVRFWDPAAPGRSCIVSGLQLHAEAAPAQQPTYAATRDAKGGCVLVTEQSPAPATEGGGGEKERRGRGGGKAAGQGVVSLQAQNLLKSHLDAVLDVCVLEFPFRMVVSVDRGGMVYVFS